MIRHAIEDGLHVRRAGNARGRPLLHVHGLGESGLCFEALIARPDLAHLLHLVPDLPGYGRTPWRDDPLSLEAEADLLAAWLRRGGIARITVVGHSMGGVVGLLLGERHPDLVEAFLDVDGNCSMDDCVYSGRAAAQSREEFLSRGMAGLLDDLHQAGLTDPSVRGYLASARICDPSQYHRNSLELVAISRTETIPRRLAALSMPAHYLGGVPRGVSERSRTLLAAAGVACTEIRDAGHWPFLDRPDAFVAALNAFLGARSRPPTEPS